MLGIRIALPDVQANSAPWGWTHSRSTNVQEPITGSPSLGTPPAGSGSGPLCSCGTQTLSHWCVCPVCLNPWASPSEGLKAGGPTASSQMCLSQILCLHNGVSLQLWVVTKLSGIWEKESYKVPYKRYLLLVDIFLNGGGRRRIFQVFGDEDSHRGLK